MAWATLHTLSPSPSARASGTGPRAPCSTRRWRTKPPPARGDQLELLGERDDVPALRKRWAWLLAHVFAADVETCPRCFGPMRWAEVANTRAQITRLLSEHGLGPRAPPSASRTTRVPEQMVLGFGEASR